MVTSVVIDDRVTAGEPIELTRTAPQAQDAPVEGEDRSFTSRIVGEVHTTGQHIPGHESPLGDGSIKRVTEADLTPDTGSVLDTARSAAGVPQARHEITKDSIVSWCGMDVCVQELARFGELILDKSGNVMAFDHAEDAHAEHVAQESKASEQAIPEGHDGRLDDVSEKTIANLVKADPELTGEIALEVANAAVDGRDVDVDMQKLGAALGSSNLGAAGAMAHLQRSLQAQADGALMGVGVEDVDRFYEWAREAHPEQLRGAVGRQLENAQLSGYRLLAEEFLAMNSI